MQLIASLLPDGSHDQQDAYSRVSQGNHNHTQRPVGELTLQAYTLRADLYTLTFIDSSGLQPIFPSDIASSVDQVWLCVFVEDTAALEASNVQDALAQLQQASLPAIVIITKAEKLFLEELTKPCAAERTNIESVVQNLKSRFSVIKDHVYVSTLRSTPFTSSTQDGGLQYPDALDTLLVTAMDHLKKPKLAAFARSTAATLDFKIAGSVAAILYGLSMRATSEQSQQQPNIPEFNGMPSPLQHTISLVFAQWRVPESIQKMICRQLLAWLNDHLRWILRWRQALTAIGCATGLLAAVMVGPVAAVAVGLVTVATNLGLLVYIIILTSLMLICALMQLSKLTGGNIGGLANDPEAEWKVKEALATYKAKIHPRVVAFCQRFKNKYTVFTAAQTKDLQDELHTFLREVVQESEVPP